MGVSSGVQVIAAIALSIILFVIAFSIYNMETVRAIQEAGKVKRQTTIFKGVKDIAMNKDESYNTLDPAHPTFKNLGMSVNQKGGAEYSYNFWMYISSDAYNTGGIFASPNFSSTTATDAGLTRRSSNGRTLSTVQSQVPLVLLLRGSKKAYPYKNLCNGPDTEMKVDLLVKNPMVKIEGNGDVLSVEINTQKSPDGVKEKSRDTCDERNTDWEYMNSYRVALKGLRSEDDLKDKWFMVTVVVQDTYPSDPLPLRNKVRVRLYVNGVMELDKYLDGKLGDTSGSSSILKNNNGNLHIVPLIKYNSTTLSKEPSSASHAGQIRMADLTYFNYAMDTAEIADVFSGGFTKALAPSAASNNDEDDGSFMDNMSVPTGSSILTQLKQN